MQINIRLQQMVTMDQMKNVMMGLGNIMGTANGKLTMKDFTNSMKTYQTEKERMQIANEMVHDAMDFEDDIDDSDVDKLIGSMEADIHRKNVEQVEQDEEEMPE